MKISDLRDELVQASISALDMIKGIAPYDALKPRIRQAVEEIIDVFVKYAGDFDASPEQELDLSILLAQFTGLISGMFTTMSLSQKDQIQVQEVAASVLNKLKAIHRAGMVHSSFPPYTKSDLN